jgi:hypothetical protein
MFALFSRFVRWLRPDGVRALKRFHYRNVVSYQPIRDGRGDELVTLECGHSFILHLTRRAVWPCEECADSANAVKPQPTNEPPEERQHKSTTIGEPIP